jgi:hypothetical protein
VSQSPPRPRSGAGPAALLIVRGIAAFGRFWWDFLVGDTPELFVVTLLILATVAVLVKEVSSTAAWTVTPLMVALALVASVLRGAGARGRRR